MTSYGQLININFVYLHLISKPTDTTTPCYWQRAMAQSVTVKATIVGSILTWENKLFNIFISSLW